MVMLLTKEMFEVRAKLAKEVAYGLRADSEIAGSKTLRQGATAARMPSGCDHGRRVQRGHLRYVENIMTLAIARDERAS